MPEELKIVLVQELVKWLPTLVGAFATATLALLGQKHLVKRRARKEMHVVDFEFEGLPEQDRDTIVEGRLSRSKLGKLSSPRTRKEVVRKAREKSKAAK